MTAKLPVAVVGAGPYGLSLAAHLRAAGVPFRIFGSPMESWRTHMPPGMFLKSEGFASSIADPGARFTLRRFAAATRREYGDYGVPVSLDTFTAYGRWFEEHAVGGVEDVRVSAVRRADGAFELDLESGETVPAGRVVVAVGISYSAYTPAELRDLPRELVSHPFDLGDLGAFAGREVAIVGAGQSALETAALLREQGASPRVVVRKPTLAWNEDPELGPRSLRQRARSPIAGLGAGWKAVVYSERPGWFSHLPETTRRRIVREALGPAGAWWLRRRVEGHMPIALGHALREAHVDGSVARLGFEVDGTRVELLADHVVAATGYRVDVERLAFLAPPLRSEIRSAGGSPVLTRHLESSAPGVYFVGLAAAISFGPAMRFVYGTRFASGRVTRRLARTAGRSPVAAALDRRSLPGAVGAR